MYAEIIINHKTRAIDRPFDYSVPPELESAVKVGSRVIIPFSRGNTETEGFVLRLKSDAAVPDGVKSVISLSSPEPAFLENMVPVIEFMHTRYLASYIDIIHCIIPTGTSMRSIEWVLLKDKSAFLGRSETDKRILKYVEDNGGGMDTISLSSYFDGDIRANLRRLEKSGVITRKFRHTRDVSHKKIRAVRIAASDGDIDAFCEKSRSTVQKRMLSVLCDCEYLSAADLVRFSGGSYGALRTLKKSGLIEFFDIFPEREVFNFDGNLTAPPQPTPEQSRAINTVNAAIERAAGETILLHGVTGSGKTEVFMRAIDRTVQSGKTAIMLVPEISLTPQMVSRFVRRFGSRIAVLHSGLSPGERYDQWTRILNGKADIVIGARSALFAPADNIGIIIIDEEHSDTYKSEMSPRYHARETAIFRAGLTGAVTLLASATPSMESYYNALLGKYTLVEMEKRFNENDMPDIDIVDMRSELESGNKSLFSKTLYEGITGNLKRGEQTILFMNRRGYSTFVSCRKCGYVPMCPNCNISLTYHSWDNSLKCHYCGFSRDNYRLCPLCGSKYIRYFGGGTQRVEAEVKKLFPTATSIRLDADVTGRKNAHKEILERFANEKIDILIGTQMVAKGLDFPNVTLVGVVSADTMLHINDFRSGERTFDTLEQVSGRAGRGSKRGRAIIQTYNPDNFAIKLVKTHDYKAFYRMTAAERRTMWYPPYSEMICIRFSDDDREKVRKGAELFCKAFGDINTISQKLAILGPIPCGVSRIKNKYRHQILIKCERADALNGRLTAALNALKESKDFSDVVVSADKNPINIY